MNRRRLDHNTTQLIVALGLFLLALGPRAFGLGVFITPDERRWIERSVQFFSALSVGDFTDTFQTGHPGVTTKWTGTVGLLAKYLSQASQPSLRAFLEAVPVHPSVSSIVGMAHPRSALEMGLGGVFSEPLVGGLDTGEGGFLDAVQYLVSTPAPLPPQGINVWLTVDLELQVAAASIAAEQAAERIHFLGWVSGDVARAQLYNAAECLLLPSRREGFPTVVGEAMSCGTPVLASDVGGVSELVAEGETGWLIPPCDDAALKRTMAVLLAQPADTASMRSAARAVAEARVSPSAVGAALRDCFSIASRPHG